MSFLPKSVGVDAAADEEEYNRDAAFETLASLDSSSQILWSGFRGALSKVDPEQVRAALMKQDSLASILSAADAPKVEEVVEQLSKKLHDGEPLSADETASVEAIEAVASNAMHSESATGVAVRAMWGVLRGELMSTSVQVDKETAALDEQLDALEVRRPISCLLHTFYTRLLGKQQHTDRDSFCI